MFGHAATLFRIAGIPIRVDITWLFIALLITVSLARGLFPQLYPGWSETAYWSAALAGALGLAVSIVVHELAHSLVARRLGVPMHGITLFAFGGMAQMEGEPPTPTGEFVMAVVGPLTSLVLAGLFHLGAGWAEGAGAAPAVVAVASLLSSLNLVLAIFNLVPAFPMDGGRMLRAVLWGASGDKLRATQQAGSAGALFGAFLIAAGVALVALTGALSGLWWVLIGFFIRSAALGSVRDMEMRDVLAGRTVGAIMHPDPVSVSPSMSVADFVQRKLYTHHQDSFPVVEHGRLVGRVGVEQIKETPREDWSRLTIADIDVATPERLIVAPSVLITDALTALMGQPSRESLMVVDDGRLVGVLSLGDIYAFIAHKTQLDKGARAAREARAPR